MVSSGALAEAYRRFGETPIGEPRGTSPLSERVAVALSQSDEALRAIEEVPVFPVGRRHPAVILAALHDLALAGHAPALAAAYATGDREAAADAAIDTLLHQTDSVAAIAVRHRVRSDESGRGTVLYPAIGRAAQLARADAIGMVDVGCSAGLNLTVDRVGITYSNGQSLGDKASPVQLSASIVGGRPVPTSLIPEVVSRIGIDRDPIDVTDPDDVRWLHACLSPDHPNRPEREARLDAEIALAASDPPALLGGDPVELLHDAFALIPPGALPVVITTWALSRFSVERRRRFWSRLADAAAQRPRGVGIRGGRRGRAVDPHLRRSPRLRAQHHRRCGARPAGAGREERAGRRPLLVTRSPARVAGGGVNSPARRAASVGTTAGRAPAAAVPTPAGGDPVGPRQRS